ncbi:MBL fold metallo-hydrolase [Kineococcus arenarius]|uniref:MBL fold metallo-hydrolase n=1 Tax=Kineococcus sp. SYSU DK007 TaxID=3383128 RepID=UPI003D7DA4E6
MCDTSTRIANDPALPAASRRRFLQALGAGAAAGTAATAAAVPAAAAPATSSRRCTARTKIVLLGTSGGPQWGSPDRTGICTAVVHDGRYYLVDLGWGASHRLVQSGIGGSDAARGPLADLAGVFFTHLHSDHVAEWPALYLTGYTNAAGRTLPPVEVFGPGDRAVPPRVFPPERPEPELVGPDAPGAGTAAMTDLLRRAFASDLNDRTRDQGQPDLSTLFSVNDIDLTGTAEFGADGIPPRLTRPIPVWDDGQVRVTATLVDHRPTAPAFAYRFDTPDGSIVISGDTTVSENLVDLAKDADHLVHECIDPEAVERIVAPLPAEVATPLREHLFASHTTIEQVGRDVAERAGARNLVLTHLSAGTSDATWRRARRGCSGRLVVGADLMEIPVGG